MSGGSAGCHQADRTAREAILGKLDQPGLFFGRLAAFPAELTEASKRAPRAGRAEVRVEIEQGRAEKRGRAEVEPKAEVEQRSSRGRAEVEQRAGSRFVEGFSLS